MNDLRAPTEDDIEAVVRLRSRHAPEPFTEERLRREWTEPGFDVERDACICDEGYAAVEATDESRTWIELHGEQAERALAWALERAPQNRVFSGCWEPNGPVRQALEAAGFQAVRDSYRMAIDLGAALPRPPLPAGIELRTFRKGDERAVYETHMETFEDSWEHIHEPFERWSHWMLERKDFDPTLWLIATEGEQIAGLALCSRREEDPTLGWVSILGVRRPWRGKGLGEALLRAAFAELASRGCERAALGVDAESLTGAQRLYERAGMHVAARFDIYERP